MLVRITTLRITVAALLAGVAFPVLAQDDEPSRPSYSRLLNIDALIDNHARFLARRYNLSEEQDAFTQAFLRQKADAYLEKHRERLFDIVDQLFEVRAGGEMDQQELIAWGRRAVPLYEEAKTLITEGNEEWRGILTEEQRRTHDEDLRQMYEGFATTEDQLERIVSGQMTIEEFRKGPARRAPRRPRSKAVPPPVANETPPADARQGGPQLTDERSVAAPRSPVTGSERGSPTASSQRGRDGARGRSAAAKGGTGFESQWEAYVREFIETYQLNDGQAQRARSILKDCQELAQRKIQRRKPELERLDKKLLALGGAEEKDKLKELAKINERRTKLLEPVNEIFEKQLKPRLEKLPTRAQRRAAEEAGKRKPAKPERSGTPSSKPPQ